MVKQYKKLDKYQDFDQEAAEEYAEAVNELRELSKRAETLRDLLVENEELKSFVWTTAEGLTIALHKIEEDHFKNILLHIVNRGDQVPRAIKAEAHKRGLDIPSASPTRYLSHGEVLIDDSEIPF